MGAHHKGEGSRLQGGQDLPLLGGLHGACEEPHLDAGGGEHGGEGLGVLLGQDLGGGHHGALPAGADGQPGAAGGHRRLARAHVALYQPVHGPGEGQVGGGLLQGTSLGSRQGEGQQLIKVLQVRLTEGRAAPPAPPLPQQGQPQGEVEELLKGEAPPGGVQGGLVGWKVDAPPALRRRCQTVPGQQAVRQGLRRRGQLPEGPLHQPGEQVVGDPRRQWVDRHDAPAGPGPLRPLELGIGHLPVAAQELHPAVEDVLLPPVEGLAHIALVEEGHQHGGGVVHHLEPGHIQAPADVHAPGLLRRHDPDAAQLPHRGLGDGIDLPPVLIASGEVAHQVPRRPEAQLLQALGPGLPHPGELPQGGVHIHDSASSRKASRS